ncbi:MAG TPA: type II toxin-antitoxin system prevent-host-death family antitoxin [Caldilineae bacterium]|nr:type II toxin-antitoxin system prevent-host-death family antitoxin [Caldilineae bacterium]
MTTVGAYEAKTHLSQLLERVARGERIVITKHGVPIAALEPVAPARQVEARKVVEALRTFRRGRRLGGLRVRDLIEEGRL